jgi:hypothetical protein
MSLEQRVKDAMAGAMASSDLNTLLQDLANNKETDALVRVWDTRGTTPITLDTWTAIEKLHNLGKGRIPVGTIIMPADRTRLPAPRRLHKIIKGRIISARSDAAKEHLPAAMEYVRTHSELNGLHRSMQAKALQKALSVNMDTARGLVTKLRCKKLLTQ